MIFIDRSVPRSVAESLKAVRRDEILWLEDKFPHDTPDGEWLPVAGSQGWLVVARDKKIRTRPLERQLVIDHKVGLFIVNQKHDPSLWEYYKLMGRCLDDMERIHASTSPPFIFLIDSRWSLRRFM